MPQAFARLPWAGHIGLQLLDEVAAIVEDHQSTLIFTNTRRQADWVGFARNAPRLDFTRAEDLG